MHYTRHVRLQTPLIETRWVTPLGFITSITPDLSRPNMAAFGPCPSLDSPTSQTNVKLWTVHSELCELNVTFPQRCQPAAHMISQAHLSNHVIIIRYNPTKQVCWLLYKFDPARIKKHFTYMLNAPKASQLLSTMSS